MIKIELANKLQQAINTFAEIEYKARFAREVSSVLETMLEVGRELVKEIQASAPAPEVSSVEKSDG